jgi:hypothetical protein
MASTAEWEYRVETIGHWWGTKDEVIAATLNDWGADGWEAVNVETPYGSGKVTIVAKRPLDPSTRRRRGWNVS